MRLAAGAMLCLGWTALSWAVELCPPLPPPAGATVHVDTVAELQTAVNSAAHGDTILIADGTYELNGVYLWVDTPGVTLRSASGNRDAVILDGNYQTTEIVTVVASDVTIADLSLRRALTHPIHVTTTDSADTLNTLIYNVHIVDPGQQAIKINPSASRTRFPDNGTIACSHIELTDAGRIQVWNINGSCYTGGVDAHWARDWTIRDNLIEEFWCSFGLSEHAVHMWRGCRDTVVERNVTRENARGIGFGLMSGGGARVYPDDPCPGAGYVGHYDGIIRNNLVFASSSGLLGSADGFDCGICLASACGARVFHNTVVSTEPPFSSIEWRWPSTDAEITNNLATHNYRQRDGATATLTGNLDSQPLSLFVDGAGGDLHLASTASVAIDQVAAPTEVVDDIDGDVRPVGPSSDVGADEYLPGDPVFADGFESGGPGGWSNAGGGSWTVTPAAAYLGSYGLEVSIGTCSGSVTEIILSDPPAPGPLSVEACLSITAGGAFAVADGSVVSFTAGRMIALYDGFTVETGGSFASIIDATLDPHGWVRDDSPYAETRYLAEFYIDLDSLALGTGDELHHFVAYSADGVPQFRLVIRDGPDVWLEVREDDGTYRSTSAGVPVASGWNRIAVSWEASTDATASLTVNDGAAAEITGLDNGATRIDLVRWGIVGGDLAGSSGTIHQDAYSSWR
jgi:hypothetical protein